jgi:hypothetical protein
LKEAKRLGCLSGTGIVSALVTLLVLAGLYFFNGGAMFSPGALNAQAGEQTLGGVRSHAETTGRCSACHTAIWQRASMADRCLECHLELLLDGTDFHSVMLAQGTQVSCLECHTDHRGAQVSLTMMDMEHFPHFDAAGFSLQAHQQNADGSPFTCSACHGEKIARFELTTCQDCHQGLGAAYMDEHLTAFGSACLDCHDGKETYGKSFDHDTTTFQLVGKHASLSCLDCHSGAHSLVELQNTPQGCYECHAKDDEHDGQFGESCADCHTSQDWEQITFDHAKSVFPLTGKHQQLECQDCHAGGVFVGTPQDCAACHDTDDAHNGELGQNCAACHTTESWQDATFDHAQSAFTLTGAHIRAACEDCHTDKIFKGTPDTCIACHAGDDEHQGQFGTDCAACHTTENWENASFDHSLSTFALTGAHIRVECTDCHTNQVFKGTPSACSACHADPGYHAGLFGSDCESCHNTGAWVPASFDRTHRFPINHGEGGNSCQVCHPSSLSNYTCYGCHEHTQANIASEHREEGISDFNNCVRCHPTGREEEGEGRGGDD